MRRFLLIALMLFVTDQASAQYATPQISFKLVDADGLPVVGAAIEIKGADEQKKIESDADGQVLTTLPNGSYEILVRMGNSTIYETQLNASKPETIQYNLPVYRFRVWVSASNGDLMDGAQARYIDSGGAEVDVQIVDGQIEGVARAGEVVIKVNWNAQTIDALTFTLPDLREEIIELPVQSLEVTVLQKDTGLGFGPVLVAAASQDNSFPAGTWTDNQGKVILPLIKGEVQLQGTWFATKAASKGSVPGKAVIEMPLATHTIPGPLNNPPADPYRVQISQPQFQIWAQGTPREGIRLPLPAGRYDVMIFNDQKKPTHRGVATIKGGQPLAEIDWQKATSTDGQLNNLVVVWPQGIWASKPTIGLQESGDWKMLSMMDNGTLGLYPPGLQLRIPNNTLGKTYDTAIPTVDVRLGVIEVQLPEPAAVKVLSATHPENNFVQRCEQAVCQIPVPPGRYLIYVPDTQLLKEPVDVTHGQKAYAYIKSL